MALKRENSDVESDVQGHTTKRRRDQPSSKSKLPEPKTDAVYGQRSVFPGLDHSTHPSDDDLEFEDEADALAYLKSVRQEADGIPHLIVAPKAGPELPPGFPGVDRSIYESGVGDSRGYYQDGAYTAAPDSDISDDDDDYEDGEYDPEREAAVAHKAFREAYFNRLSSQFQALRAKLHRDPPAALVAALDNDHDIEVGGFGPRNSTFQVWSHRIRNTDPLPVQIAAMDRRNALKLLRIILGGKFIRRGYELRERTSRWIWSLLARLPDRGEMDYTEVGWVRELGKRAVLMMVPMTQMEALQERVDDDLEGEHIDSAAESETVVVEVEVDDHDDPAADITSAAPGNQLNNPPTVSADAAPQLDIASQPGSIQQSKAEPKPDDDGEMAMDLDDAEVSISSSSTSKMAQTDFEAAKARLLAQLEKTETEDELKVKRLYEEQKERALFNARATLNMILTVAGDFYGQRDLLEFRDPFPSV